MIIDRAASEDLIVFFDDDFFPHADYLQRLEEIFLKHRDVVVCTGLVIADGVVGPGLSVDEARAILAADNVVQSSALTLQDVYNGYGCNMAVRADTIRQNGIVFDEALPLYGWLEDVDFSRRLSVHGRIVQAANTRGVHLGDKKGRQKGILLGYSQIANPVYLAKKRTLSWPRALKQIGRNVGANCLKSIAPEPYIDRRGRILGHALALVHLCLGKMDPRRVLEFQDFSVRNSKEPLDL